MKKKPFLLLEILIGLFLIELIALPLLIKPISIYRSEIQSFEELEGERLADLTFTEIKEKLLKNEIPWEKLPKGGEEKGFNLSSLEIFLPESKPKSIQRRFELQCDKTQEREGNKGEVYRFLKVKVYFVPCLKKKGKFYLYHIFVRQLKRELEE